MSILYCTCDKLDIAAKLQFKWVVYYKTIQKSLSLEALWIYSATILLQNWANGLDM